MSFHFIPSRGATNDSALTKHNPETMNSKTRLPTNQHKRKPRKSSLRVSVSSPRARACQLSSPIHQHLPILQTPVSKTCNTSPLTILQTVNYL